MSLLALEKSIKYYLKIKSNTMSLIHTIFDESYNVLLGSRVSFNWSAKIKETLDKAGYSYIWTILTVYSKEDFVTTLYKNGKIPPAIV